MGSHQKYKVSFKEMYQKAGQGTLDVICLDQVKQLSNIVFIDVDLLLNSKREECAIARHCLSWMWHSELGLTPRYISQHLLPYNRTTIYTGMLCARDRIGRQQNYNLMWRRVQSGAIKPMKSLMELLSCGGADENERKHRINIAITAVKEYLQEVNR